MAAAKKARGDDPPHYLHLLNLAWWGLENGVDGEWPSDHRYVVEMQVGILFGWKAKNVIEWLLSNPNGPDGRSEQEANLLNALMTAESPCQAAAIVLNEICSRQQADSSALQPAASELR